MLLLLLDANLGVFLDFVDRLLLWASYEEGAIGGL